MASPGTLVTEAREARASRVAPALVLAFFVLASVVHAAVPWKVLDADGRDREVAWAHQYGETPFLGADDFGFFGGAAPDPTRMSLAGLVAGVVLAGAWWIVASLSSRAVLTARREAAFFALAAIPLFLVASGAARAVGHALQRASLDDVGAVSPAGIALLALAIVATFGLAAAIARRLRDARAAVAIAGAVVASAAFQAVPWHVAETGRGDTSFAYRDLMRMAGPGMTDALGPLAGGILVLLLVGVAWAVAAALVDGARWRRIVDGLAGVACLAPALLAVGPVADVVASTLATSLGSARSQLVTVNGFVFLALVAGLVALALATASRATSALDAEEAPA